MTICIRTKLSTEDRSNVIQKCIQGDKLKVKHVEMDAKLQTMQLDHQLMCYTSQFHTATKGVTVVMLGHGTQPAPSIPQNQEQQ